MSGAARAWSEKEVEAAVADYLAMLADEARGQAYNKAAHNRELQRVLDRRPRTSVEFKHRNITAALHDLGYPGIDGYKPLPNYQGLLFDVVQRMVMEDESLRRLIARRVDAEVDAHAASEQELQLSDPPSFQHAGIWVAEPRLASRRTRRGQINYLEREARNASLGKAGESLVLEYERRRLREAGEPALATKVTSATEALGDGAGFDIHSFEVEGSDRLIEVKTTAWSRETPLFVSRNEVAFSSARSENYFLYRVFCMRRTPQLYTVKGALSDSFRLVPELYSGRVA